MVFLPFSPKVYTLVTNAGVTEERLDDAVYRILLFKKRFGILDFKATNIKVLKKAALWGGFFLCGHKCYEWQCL